MKFLYHLIDPYDTHNSDFSVNYQDQVEVISLDMATVEEVQAAQQLIANMRSQIGEQTQRAEEAHQRALLAEERITATIEQARQQISEMQEQCSKTIEEIRSELAVKQPIVDTKQITKLECFHSKRSS